MLFKGYFVALEAGLLDGAPDVRCQLVMSSFAGEAVPLAVNLDDLGVIDEFDGVGYAELNCASVTAAYVDDDEEWQLDFTSGAGSEFGATVAAGSDVIYGMLVYLYVDGTDANDYALGFTKDGGFGVNANNGPLNLTLPDSGLLFNREA